MAELYHDRKMLKWLPFQSLPQQGDDLNAIFAEAPRTRPQLSEDDYAQMQYCFEEAFTQRSPVCITFFRHGQTQTTQGCILGFDTTQKTLILTQETLYIEEIIALDIC